MNKSYRPEKWNDYLGQEKIISNLKIYVQSAIEQEKSLDHIIIHGPSGMGKTSLAFLISKILKTKLHTLNGPSLQKPSDLISILTAIKENQILFIDEIHAISKEVLEVLYPVLEDNKLSIIIGKEYNSKIVNVKLPNFTIIGATTEINKLPFPLVNRFPINFQLANYSINELSKIILNAAKVCELPLKQEEATFIAKHSRNTPRVAINIVKRIKDFFVTKTIETINIVNLKKVFNQMGIHNYGLTDKDIEYLKLLEKNNYLGVENISQILDIPTATIIHNIEPLLIREKLVYRTFKGRTITEKGKEYVQNKNHLN